MPAATLDEIVEQEARTLPPDEQMQLRDEFAKYEKTSSSLGPLLIAGLLCVYLFKQKNLLTHEEWQQLSEAFNRAATRAGLSDKAGLVRTVRGKYAHLATSSETFAARKREEVRLEDGQ